MTHPQHTSRPPTLMTIRCKNKNTTQWKEGCKNKFKGSHRCVVILVFSGPLSKWVNRTPAGPNCDNFKIWHHTKTQCTSTSQPQLKKRLIIIDSRRYIGRESNQIMIWYGCEVRIAGVINQIQARQRAIHDFNSKNIRGGFANSNHGKKCQIKSNHVILIRHPMKSNHVIRIETNEIKRPKIIIPIHFVSWFDFWPPLPILRTRMRIITNFTNARVGRRTICTHATFGSSDCGPGAAKTRS